MMKKQSVLIGDRQQALPSGFHEDGQVYSSVLDFAAAGVFGFFFNAYGFGVAAR